MSSIEGKPISTFTFEFEVSENAVTSIMRYQEEQTMVKTLKTDKFLIGRNIGQDGGCAWAFRL